MCSMQGAMATGSMKRAAAQLISGVSKWGSASQGALTIPSKLTWPISTAET